MVSDLLNYRQFALAIAFLAFWSVPLQAVSGDEPETLPNIVLILADDLGYGDVGCYHPKSKIPTPHLDRLAAEGMRFTDAHSPCTVCTPTRFSLLTGKMAFRVPRGGTVFTGAGGPSLIAAEQLTLAEMLREKGYTTACFGKWHVGLTFFDASNQPINKGGLDAVKRIDYSRAIRGGPLDHGFQHFYGTACCPTTDWLYAYIDGDRIPVPPKAQIDKQTLPKHPYANDCRRGMKAENFDLETVDLVFLEKSQAFLKQQVAQRPDKPFFLFHSTQGVHLPSFPAKPFQGKTDFGPHGDFIFELDHVVGQLMKTLEQLGVADETIVIFTSDNGPEVPTVFHMRKDFEHDGAHPWRGMKRDNWEGGHRIPFIVRWPGRVRPGSKSNQLISLTDVMATVAAITGSHLPNDAAEDSYDMLPAWVARSDDEPVESIRDYLLMQGFGGKRTLAIRQGQWKYLAHRGSGGNNYAKSRYLVPYQLPNTAPNAPGHLYDLKSDPGETTNLYERNPEKVAELKSLLENSITRGRSAPTR